MRERTLLDSIRGCPQNLLDIPFKFFILHHTRHKSLTPTGYLLESQYRRNRIICHGEVKSDLVGVVLSGYAGNPQ
jgi:hypothetical protein